METEKNPEEMMKELDAKIAELNKIKEELGQNAAEAKTDVNAEAAADENDVHEPHGFLGNAISQQAATDDDPLEWWQGAIVLGIPAVLGFVGGILAGVGIGKKA